jgi:hypothetical protein
MSLPLSGRGDAVQEQAQRLGLMGVFRCAMLHGARYAAFLTAVNLGSTSLA